MPGPCFCRSQFNIECLECLEHVFVFNMERLSVWSVFWRSQFNMECLECLECVFVFNMERLSVWKNVGMTVSCELGWEQRRTWCPAKVTST